MRALTLVPFLLLLPRYATWDEPWHEDVVRGADTFVKVKVLENEKGKKVTAKVLDRVAGGAIPDQLAIDAYYALGLKTTFVRGKDGDDELHFRLRKDNEYYLFLKPSDQGGSFALATPTAGWANVTDTGVIATYRHSCHLCLVPEAIYRDTQKAIFQSLHGSKHDDAAMQKFLREWLTKPPGELGDDAEKSKVFFCQHAALECFYYFGKPDDVGLLEPFLTNDTQHAQISAVRALSRVDSPKTRERLFAFLTGGGCDFAKVMAVRALRRLDARDYLARLEQFVPKAPTDEVGFGIGIMDPRIGTQFPKSVKAAVEELVAEWKKPKAEAPAKEEPAKGGTPKR